MQPKPLRNSAIPPKETYAKHNMWRSRTRPRVIGCATKARLAYRGDTPSLRLCDPSVPSLMCTQGRREGGERHGEVRADPRGAAGTARGVGARPHRDAEAQP